MKPEVHSANWYTHHWNANQQIISTGTAQHPHANEQSGHDHQHGQASQRPEHSQNPGALVLVDIFWRHGSGQCEYSRWEERVNSSIKSTCLADWRGRSIQGAVLASAVWNIMRTMEACTPFLCALEAFRYRRLFYTENPLTVLQGKRFTLLNSKWQIKAIHRDFPLLLQEEVLSEPQDSS